MSDQSRPAPPSVPAETTRAQGKTTLLGENTAQYEAGLDYTDGYRVTVGWSDDDKAWIARISGVSTGDVIADGDSPVTALLDLACSAAATIDAVNDPLPAPVPPADTAARERVAQLIAHRACGSEEHDPSNGKLHGFCVVCLVPWPCEIAKSPAASPLETAPATGLSREERTEFNAANRPHATAKVISVPASAPPTAPEESSLHDRDDRLRRRIEQLERVIFSEDVFGMREAVCGVVNAWRDIHPRRSSASPLKEKPAISNKEDTAE